MKSSLLKVALATAVIGAVAANVSVAAENPHGWTNNPYHPAYDHPYRHGAVPTRETKAAMDRWNKEFYHHGAAFASTQPSSSQGQLTFGGGVSGVGVGSGQVKVYLVFYGNQWGTQSGSDPTTTSGYYAFSGDASGAAAAVQKMFKGIGTNNETWQADLTQWCDGPAVANGASACPSNANFVPYQTNALAGVWYDNSAASPSQATGTQLAQEAVKAAAHFGNTATGSNRYTYYVILSPHGTNPDNYKSPTQGYCAWHDYTGDGYGVTAPGGDIAFSNQPYNIDVGSSCGTNFVNAGSAGTTDGYTMTLGHEWHEMMSDMFPAGGWTNHTGGTYNGQENSDECAWLSPGTAGGAANITFATGTFAEQASWSNDTGNCAISHTILTHGGGGGGTPTASFSFTTNGLTANFTDTSTDSGGTIGSHSWNFGDGATSTATNPSHTYAAAGSYTVTETVKDSVDATKTSTATKSVSVSSGGTSSQLLGNTGFETGTAAPWTTTSGVVSNSTSEPPHAGSWDAWMDGYGTTHTDTVSQTVTIPAGKTSGTLSFYLHIDTAETTTTTAYDKLTVQVGSTTVATFSNLNKASGYQVHSYNVAVTAGSSVTIKFTGTEDSSLQTSFVLDDVTFTVQ